MRVLFDLLMYSSKRSFEFTRRSFLAFFGFSCVIEVRSQRWLCFFSIYYDGALSKIHNHNSVKAFCGPARLAAHSSLVIISHPVVRIRNVTTTETDSADKRALLAGLSPPSGVVNLDC